MIINATDSIGQIFLDKINDRIKNNQNCMLCFIGQTGSGKSYASMSLALTLDLTFNVDRIYFDISKFIDDLSANKFTKGQVIVIDDSGISISNRDWQSIFNKSIGIIAQSFRFLNLILIFNVPRIRFIELQVRSLIHFYLIHKGNQGNFSVLESKEINDLNTELDIEAEKIELSEDSVLSEIYFLMPYDTYLIKEYEKRKAKFMGNLYKDLSLEIKNGKGNIEVECEYCHKKNYVKATLEHFKCKYCNIRNDLK